MCACISAVQLIFAIARDVFDRSAVKKNSQVLKVLKKAVLLLNSRIITSRVSKAGNVFRWANLCEFDKTLALRLCMLYAQKFIYDF